MIIVNPGAEDYHMHSITYSDGMSEVEVIVEHAGEFGLKKIAITDHSQAVLDYHHIPMKTFREHTRRWENVHNDVEVIFGIEGDLINEEGDICDHIHQVKGDFLILSAHIETYQGNPQNINLAYRRAIEQHHEHIDFVGHAHAKYFSSFVDMGELVRVANDHEVPLEFNCVAFLKGNSDQRQLELMLERADRIYVNSDAHFLSDLKYARAKGLEYLRQQGLIE